ncbi:unnamed protein product [Effrenium voratum]|nr:unnamed protein product [Effrenium voratum]
MSRSYVRPGIVSHNAAISACETGQWERALCALHGKYVRLDVVSFSAMIASCGASGKWSDALGLMGGMGFTRVLPNSVTCNSLISACEESGQWDVALGFFTRLASPGTMSVNAGISACSRGMLWRSAASLLDGLLQSSSRRATLVSFNAAMTACGNCKQWSTLMGIMQQLSRSSLQPDAISLNAAAGVLEWQGRWAGAAGLLAEAQAQGERLLAAEAATLLMAVDSCQRSGTATRAAGLLGSIVRDTSQSLQRIENCDAGKFDNDTIGQVLADADESGDGELQISEFVSWLFAEEKDLAKGRYLRGGGQTILVEGCSREELNGEYAKQTEVCGDRPVFYCGSTEMCLFYHSENQAWQIYTTLFSTRASARLKTQRSPYKPAGAVWEVGKKGEQGAMEYVPEPDMACRVLPPPETAEEELARAPEWILVESTDSRISGFFNKQSQPVNGRPAYKNSADQTYMVFNGPEKHFWKVCMDEAVPETTLAWSKPSDIWSPHLTSWHGNVSVMPVYPDTGFGKWIKSTDANQTKRFVDPEFPHSDKSLGKDWGDIEWARVIWLGPSSMELFKNLEPAHVCQGAMGDCWLIAAIAAVAEFPNYVRDQLFCGTSELTEDGKYNIRLFDHTVDDWRVVTIDDSLPCKARCRERPQPSPLFVKLRGGEAYVPLLEKKAFGKFVGSYQNLLGGWSNMAFYAMTGQICFTWRRSSTTFKKNPTWTVTSSEGVLVSQDKGGTELGTLAEGAKFEELKQEDRNWLQFKKLEGDGPEEGWLSYYDSAGYQVASCEDNDWVGSDDWTNPKTLSFRSYKMGNVFGHVNRDALWEKIREYDDSNYLMACVAMYKKPSHQIVRKRRQDGIVAVHGYSLIHAVEVEGWRMVCCRNPWGWGCWNGPWSPGSREWEQHPSVAEALNARTKTSGMFWMTFHDFTCTWSMIQVCPKTMPTRRGDFDLNSFV